MNNHKMACVLLFLLIGGMLFGTQKMHQRTVAAREASETAQSNATTAEQDKNVAANKLKMVDAKTQDLRSSYEEWLPHFESVRNPEAGEQRISELVRKGGIFLLSQKYEEREINTENMISHALVATLVVEDDYVKTMNWLGKIEESIPASRVSKARIIRGDRGNNIHLEVTILVPALKS